MEVRKGYFFMKSYLKFYLVIILLSLVATRQLFLPGYFPMHDDLQVGRLYQMDKCIRGFQLPCRWAPDMGYGYGYPLFNFYPPFPYYLGEVFHLLGFSFINSVKLLFIVGFVLSGVFVFLLGKEFWGDLGGLASAIFYIFAPYHAVDVYVRGAMGEFWAIVFFPVIFWAIAKALKNRQKRYIAFLALFYGLLLLSHNIMSMIFSPLMVAWALFLVWYYHKPLRTLVPVVIGGIWGLGLAGFFTLPAFFEKKYVHVETMLMGYFNYLAHFVPIKKLFLERFWGYGSSGWGQTSGMPFQIGYLHWGIPAVALILFTFLLLKRKIRLDYFLLFTFYFLLSLGAAFMAHIRSTPIWQTIKPLEYLQFPWRFLALVIFGFSFASGGVIFGVARLVEKKMSRPVCKLLTAGLIAAVVILNFSYFKPEKVLPIIDEEKLFSPKGWNKLQTDAIFDYLPIYAQQPPAAPAPEEPEVLEGKVGITYLKRGTNWYQFHAKVIGDLAQLRLPIYDFPGWKVWVDKKSVPIDYDNFLGLITFKIPKGDHHISARLTNTPIRTVSNLISFFSWLVFAFVLVQSIEQRYFQA